MITSTTATAFREAVEQVSSRNFSANSDHPGRVLFVLIDGADSSSRHSALDVVESSMVTDGIVFAIVVGSEESDSRTDRVLRTLTTKSGGTSYWISDISGLPQALAEIDRRLSEKPGFHSIQLASISYDGWYVHTQEVPFTHP